MNQRRELAASPYRDAHAASARRKNDRVRSRPATLRALVRWATSSYALETPPLDHSQSDVDDMGDPEMRRPAQAYLGLIKRDDGPDDWVAIACRKDIDGQYVTPMRAALALLERDNHERAAFLRALVIHVYHHKDVCRMFGIPDWCAGDVTHRSLSVLWDKYAELPLPRRKGPGWTEISESQRQAIEAGEAA